MALLDLSHVKSIHARIQLIVYGYFREHRQFLFGNDESVAVPPLIIHICLLFYYYDTWDKQYIGKELQIDADNPDIVRYPDGNNTHMYNSAFLTRVCDSNDGGIYYWKFKLISMQCVWNIIGVWKVEENKIPPRNTYFTNGKDVAYGLCLTNGKLVKVATGGSTNKLYADPIKANDIIEMYLDFDNMELRFTINNKDYGKAFDIAKSKYRAAICLQNSERYNDKQSQKGAIQLLQE